MVVCSLNHDKSDQCHDLRCQRSANRGQTTALCLKGALKRPRGDGNRGTVLPGLAAPGCLLLPPHFDKEPKKEVTP